MYGSDLAVLGGKVFALGYVVESDVLIRNGRIVQTGKGLSAEDCPKIDASGMLVLPGVIDSHVHMREPGFPEKEDFASGTAAAAAGGVTTVLEMPNSFPPVDSVRRLMDKRKLIEPRAAVDFGMFAVLHDGDAKDIVPLVEMGVVGFKAFLGPTTGAIPPPSDATILESMVALRERGVPIAFHAEDAALVEYFSESLKKEGRSDPMAHIEARPPVCEAVSIERVARLAGMSGGKAHIVHMSTAEGVALVAEHKKLGTRITCETCPQYLSMTTGDMKKFGPLVKINPPLRSGRDRAALWQGVSSGVVDTLGSDHAPHLAKEKRNKDIWEVPGGFIGVETLVPIMLDFVNRGKLTIKRFVEMTSRNPSILYNLYPRKGELLTRADGDLTIVDMKERHVIREAELHSKQSITPFDGREVKGRVKYTVVRGQVVYDGESVHPSGSWVRPLLDAEGQVSI
ncbi:MAG TPA: dihydroorotase family protein [Conexivisphaerales archaeon]|nr:dihydroorotase family protein [Conexivisphaerales archaeon]